MGPVSKAAGILFAEFNRLGVLESQFYENDSVFASRKKYVPDPQERARFEELLARVGRVLESLVAEHRPRLLHGHALGMQAVPRQSRR